jgi:hypothetical protein
VSIIARPTLDLRERAARARERIRSKLLLATALTWSAFAVLTRSLAGATWLTVAAAAVAAAVHVHSVSQQKRAAIRVFGSDLNAWATARREANLTNARRRNRYGEHAAWHVSAFPDPATYLPVFTYDRHFWLRRHHVTKLGLRPAPDVDPTADGYIDSLTKAAGRYWRVPPGEVTVSAYDHHASLITAERAGREDVPTAFPAPVMAAVEQASRDPLADDSDGDGTLGEFGDAS